MVDGIRAQTSLQDVYKRLDKIEESQADLREIMADQTKKLAEIIDLLKGQKDKSEVMQEDGVSSAHTNEHSPQPQKIKAAGMEREAKWIVCIRKTSLTTLSECAHYTTSHLEFYSVDSGSLVKDVLPPLRSIHGRMCMVRLEGSIYIVGGMATNDIYEPEPNADPKNVFNYTGACRLSSDGTRWEQIEAASILPRTCALLEGKLYGFTRGNLFPEVFDPQLGTWKQLRSKGPPASFGVGPPLSIPVLSDGSRILVHLSDGALWAYRPPTSTAPATWEQFPTAQGFEWSEAVAVADNVVYIHDVATRRVFRALDLDTSKWLKVVWSSKRCADYDVKFTLVDFDALVYLGDGLFELGSWQPPNCYIDIMIVYMLRFKSDYDRATSTLHLTPLTSHVYRVSEDLDNVFGYLPPPCC